MKHDVPAECLVNIRRMWAAYLSAISPFLHINDIDGRHKNGTENMPVCGEKYSYSTSEFAEY